MIAAIIVFLVVMVVVATCFDVVLTDKYLKSEEEVERLNELINKPLFTIDNGEQFQSVGINELMNKEASSLEGWLYISHMIASRQELLECFDLYLETDKGLYRRCGNPDNIEYFCINDNKLELKLIWPDINVNKDCQIFNGYVTFDNKMFRNIPECENLTLCKGDVLKVNLDHNVKLDSLLN